VLVLSIVKSLWFILIAAGILMHIGEEIVAYDR
jgi:hypothetical protein